MRLMPEIGFDPMIQVQSEPDQPQRAGLIPARMVQVRIALQLSTVLAPTTCLTELLHSGCCAVLRTFQEVGIQTFRSRQG
jgi:hypothetical protein